MFRRVAVLAVALSMSALAAACTGPAPPTPTSTPSPTFACIPEAGGDPVPCGPIEYEQAQKRDKLYAEAEAIFRKYWAEYDRQYHLPHPTLTEPLVETTMGTFRGFLESEFEQESFRQQVEGDVLVLKLDRLPGLARQGSVVALTLCFDSRSARFRAPDGSVTPGVVARERLFFAREGDSLKIISSEGQQVESC